MKLYVITDQNHDYGIHEDFELSLEVRRGYKAELPDCEFYAFTVDEEGRPETQFDPIFAW